MKVEYNVRMAMRDGTCLSADVYRPSSSGNLATTVLVRTCYTKGVGPFAQRGEFWTNHGYAYIVQDVRGRGDSDGIFEPLRNELEDGSDTLDWIAAQAWSDGRVVMTGGSYLGWTQFYAACSGNAHLVGIIPMATPADPDCGFPISSGMIMPAAACWLATLDGHINQDLGAVDISGAISHRPLIDLDRKIGRRLPSWREWVAHVLRSEYWEALSYQRRLAASPLPMWHVSGWYDDCLSGSLRNYTELTRSSHHSNPWQRLLVGPWTHSTIGQRKAGGTDFGPAAEVDLPGLQLRWFNACRARRVLPEPTVRLFVMGLNVWIEAEQWPLPGTDFVSYYLHSGGRANSSSGDGRLSTEPPGEEPVDRFTHNPETPVPHREPFDWKQVGGPDDCSEIERRQDVLVYSTEVLRNPLVICGPLRVQLFASTSAQDTDWVASIHDVHPDGRSIRLNDGAIRARFRAGNDRERFITPGDVRDFEIDCWATCIELPAGHCLRLMISSSVLGKFDVNMNGGGPVGQEIEAVVAQQTVYHDALHKSRLLLPVLHERGKSS